MLVSILLKRWGSSLVMLMSLGMVSPTIPTCF
jgi:carbonic anhydrase